MPAWDFDCAACGQRFEVVHGVHAEPPTTCPLCGSGPIRKAISAPAIHYKGSGWAKKERRATATPGTSKATSDGTANAEPGPKTGSETSDASSPSPSPSPSPVSSTSSQPPKAAEAGAPATHD